MEFTKNLKEAEEYDKFKSRVLKYVLYKKRTESEVREKFKDEEKIDDVIDFLIEYGYINDVDYIERSIAEFKSLKNLSLKEVNYKLLQKGIKRKILDNYICEHKEELLEYEINSAKNIINKKSSSMEEREIKEYLYKKGYMSESINIAIDEI